MLYICLMAILLMFLISYKFSKSFISPFSLINMITFASCTIILVNNERWGYPIGIRFVEYLLLTLLFFGLGCALISVIDASNLKENKKIRFDTKHNNMWIKYYPETIINMLSIVLAVAYISMIISKVGFHASLTNLLRGIYEYSTSNDGTNKGNFVRNQIQTNVMAMGYISVFAFFSDFYYSYRFRKRYSLLLPALMHCVCTLFSTDRNILLRFIIYCLVIWILFYKNQLGSTKRKINKVIFKKGVLVVAFAVALFFVYGLLKEYKSSFGRAIGIYGGSGFYDYNYYLEKIYPTAKLEYGKNTFLSLRSTLEFLGLMSGRQEVALHGQDFIYGSNGYASNIYSGLYNPTRDFGIIGACIIMFIEGMYYEFLYNLTLKRGYGYSWIFYASMIYPVLYFPISEQLFGRMHLGLVYEVFWLLLWYLIIKYLRIKQARCAKRSHVRLSI